MIKNYNTVLINLIIFIHIFLIVFIIITPLTCDKSLIRINIIVMVFLLYSWYIDSINSINGTRIGRCGLTHLECKLRGIEYEDGFIYKIIKPFKIINDKTCSIMITLFILFWIYYNYDLLTQIDK
jgi:hypothetical protein